MSAAAITPEEAYNSLLSMLEKSKKIAEEMKAALTYSPFDHLPFIIEHELRDIRKRLIDQAVAKFRNKYMPNAKPDADFSKIMDQQAGELGFKEDVIESWFLYRFTDKQLLVKMSLENLLDLSRAFVPYDYDEKHEWGLLKDWHRLLDEKDSVLVLHAHTWSADRYTKGVSYSLNSRGEYEALEKLIEAVTSSQDIVTVRASWLTDHIGKTRQDAAAFYGRHNVTHGAVRAFEFFKNKTLRIWFKQPDQARAIARTLCLGSLVKPEITALVP